MLQVKQLTLQLAELEKANAELRHSEARQSDQLDELKAELRISKAQLESRVDVRSEATQKMAELAKAVSSKLKQDRRRSTAMTGNSLLSVSQPPSPSASPKMLPSNIIETSSASYTANRSRTSTLLSNGH